jgi:hypothetical protein
VDVVYADVDLMAVSAIDEATAELNELGFFAAALSCTGRTATTTSVCNCSIPRTSSSTKSSVTRRSQTL